MRILRGVVSVTLATVLWISSFHLWFARDPDDLARPLAARQLALWQPANEAALDASLAAMRSANPEWDLMARMFLVLAFANLAIDASTPQVGATYAAAIDRIIERTEADVARRGMHEFLLPYGRAGVFHDHAGRSLFVDGELAMMMVARYAVTREPAHADTARGSVDRVRGQLER